MYSYCTYFDRQYLARGLALYTSLKSHCQDSFSLWILCMDRETQEILTRLDLPGVKLISLREFEAGDEDLVRAKRTRSLLEYYFTCTPSLPLYILNHYQEVDLITYLDADLFFFSDPAPLFDEIADDSIAVIAHRFCRSMRHLERYGIFNVGWLSFRRDDQGLACLRQWRDQCLAWCYDRVENGRFADQKYLDDWPERFQNVVVLQHKGANLAPWNVSNYGIRFKDGRVWVEDQSLIFYHFQELTQVRPWLFRLNLSNYNARVTKVIRRGIYSPYLLALTKISRSVTPGRDEKVHGSIVRYQQDSRKEQEKLKAHLVLARRLWMLYVLIIYIFRGEYIFTIRQHTW